MPLTKCSPFIPYKHQQQQSIYIYIYIIHRLIKKHKINLEVQLEALSLSLHHDASTGTAPSSTAMDYYKRLSYGNQLAGIVGSDLMREKYKEIFEGEPVDFSYCFFTNESVSKCDPMNNFGGKYKRVTCIYIYIYIYYVYCVIDDCWNI